MPIFAAFLLVFLGHNSSRAHFLRKSAEFTVCAWFMLRILVIMGFAGASNHSVVVLHGGQARSDVFFDGTILMLRILSVLTLATAALAAANPASASINLKFKEVDPGNGSGPVNLVYGANGSTVRANIGRLVWQTSNDIGSPAISPNGADIATFCIELSQYVSGAFKTYDKTALADAPNPGIAGNTSYSIGPTRGEALDLLADNYWGVATGSSIVDAVAFQLAVWEIVHETPTGPTDNPALAANLDVNVGQFYVNENNPSTLLADSIAKANTWLSQISSSQLVGNDQTSLIALTHQSKQDQIIQYTIPEPLSAMVWVGLLGSCISLSNRQRT